MKKSEKSISTRPKTIAKRSNPNRAAAVAGNIEIK